MLHKTKTGKALALLLAAVMLFAGIPFSTSAEGDGTELQLENLFRREDGTNAIESSRGIDMNVETGAVTTSPALTAADIDNMHDGDTVKHEDWPWVDSLYRGAEYILDDLYYVKEMVIYFGYDQNPDKYRVYASDNPDTLYDEASIVADNVDGKTAPTTITIDKEIKCVAVVAIGYTIYNTRPKEFELYGAKRTGGDEFVSENLFQTALESKHEAVYYPWNNGELKDEENGGYQDVARFDSRGALDGSVDGNLDTSYDVYTYDVGSDNLVGARYHLNDVYYCGELKLYSGTPDRKDIYKVYASDSLDTLYNKESLVTDRAVCDGTVTTVEIDREIRYISLFLDSEAMIAENTETLDKDGRVKEFQLWSGEGTGDEPEEPEPDESLKVLTIGNSFSENASAYASEIAAVNGLSLTFGYLKFPSCTIARHYEAAVNNKAVFKFEITDPTGKRTTIKQEAASWDSPDPEKCATIQEALEYMDWDVIVFQQESYTSLDASSFADLPKLIEYVKGFCPDARLMIHEVWAWGTWENDPDKDFSKIKANYEAAAEANGLAIIPSGLGFEYAREALGDYTIVNEDDGNYQHANSYGKYVAGCCYVGALFGVTIDPDTFKEHAEINKDGYAEQLTAAANKAILYYSSCAEGNHSYVEKVDAEYLKSAATCTKKAVYYKSCSVCGDKSDETFEYGDVDGTKHGETEVRDAVAATEEQEGYTGDTYCKDCGKKIASGTTIPKLEHTHNLVKTEAKPATHYEAGNLEYYRCSVCGKYYKDSDATVETTLEEVTIAKGEHSYSYKSDENGHWEECECGDKLQSAAHTFGQWVVTKDPTATEKGSQERTCSVCGYREVAEIDAIGGATEPEDPSSGEQDLPVTGRDASFVMLAFILLMSSAGIGAVAVKAKRKPQ